MKELNTMSVLLLADLLAEQQVALQTVITPQDEEFLKKKVITIRKELKQRSIKPKIIMQENNGRI